MIPPEQPAHQLGYNKIDQENSYDPPDIGLPNDKTDYRYNLDKQLTAIERPDGQTITLNYNPSSGQLETLQTPQGDYA